MTTAATTRVHHKPDEADRELLNALQAGLAFVREPFAEIGERIGMTSRTVKTHVQNLLTKLDTTDRTGAVARGFRLGLIR